jgi:hypothetical protein
MFAALTRMSIAASKEQRLSTEFYRINITPDTKLAFAIEIAQRFGDVFCAFSAA